ncbi:hypothetical protein, partial [Bacillus velezensis]|uniref:hypothetical protein n=1 Tax=Bacillus velezensis TaxID=492670 RepID=UPI001C92F577
EEKEYDGQGEELRKMQNGEWDEGEDTVEEGDNKLGLKEFGECCGKVGAEIRKLVVKKREVGVVKFFDKLGEVVFVEEEKDGENE